MDRELFAFAQKAFELGMDLIQQQEQTIEARSVSFRPLRFGYPGFIDFLGRTLESLDWKLSWIEDQTESETVSDYRPAPLAPHWYALGPRSGCCSWLMSSRS